MIDNLERQIAAVKAELAHFEELNGQLDMGLVYFLGDLESELSDLYREMAEEHAEECLSDYEKYHRSIFDEWFEETFL